MENKTLSVEYKPINVEYKTIHVKNKKKLNVECKTFKYIIRLLEYITFEKTNEKS